MTEEKEIELDLTKKYKLPKFTVISYLGKYIVVFPEIGKWLILGNEAQCFFLTKLKDNTIQDAIDVSNINQDDIENVLIQIEAKSICHTTVFEKPIGKSMHLYLTNACNLRCPHCYMNADIKKENELSTEEILSIINAFKISGGTKVVLSGGEVLMRHDFTDIVTFCGKLELEVEVLTNGVLWNRTILDKVGKYISKIQISIDGFNEGENSKVRGKGSFSKALQAIELIGHFNIPIEVAVTPYYDESLKSKISEYANFGKWLLSKYPRKITAVKFTGEIFDGRDIKFTEAQKAEYLEIAHRIYQECYDATGDEAFVEYHKKGGIEGNCNYGNLAIDAIGNIYFCPAVNLMKPLGNFKQFDLIKLFNKTSDLKIQSHVDKIKPCNTCDIRYICGGECRALHFNIFSDCKEAYNGNAGVRICNELTKAHYYEMMIRTNEYTFE